MKDSDWDYSYSGCSPAWWNHWKLPCIPRCTYMAYLRCVSTSVQETELSYISQYRTEMSCVTRCMPSRYLTSLLLFKNLTRLTDSSLKFGWEWYYFSKHILPVMIPRGHVKDIYELAVLVCQLEHLTIRFWFWQVFALVLLLVCIFHGILHLSVQCSPTQCTHLSLPILSLTGSQLMPAVICLWSIQPKKGYGSITEEWRIRSS